MAPTNPGDAVDVVIDGAAAARDTLIELLSIVTHDVNNPLQSLIVLLELSVDDAPAGSDARARAEQCQLAADRIRSLTGALAGLLRGRREDGPRVWARALALLGRRFDRMGVTTRADVSRLADVALPSAFFFALCSACLLVLASAANGRLRGYLLEVTGTVEDDGVAFELALVAIDASAPPLLPEWDGVALARLRGLVAAEDEVVAVVTPGRVHLSARTESALT